MPCNGVAVATAKVSNDLVQYLSLMTPEIISQAVQAYLEQKYPTWQPVTTRIYQGQIYITISRQTVVIDPIAGQVRASGTWTAADLRESLVNGIGDLLTGLAGYALQQQLIQKISQQARITGSQTATNGAVVLSVEI